jgi:hypothetical protein
MSLPEEPSIVINGVPLTHGQAMTVRVAVSNFWDTLTTKGLGEDEMGKSIAAGYRERLKEVFGFMRLK